MQSLLYTTLIQRLIIRLPYTAVTLIEQSHSAHCIGNAKALKLNKLVEVGINKKYWNKNKWWYYSIALLENPYFGTEQNNHYYKLQVGIDKSTETTNDGITT